MDDGDGTPGSGKHRLHERATGWPPVAGELDPGPPAHARATVAPPGTPVPGRVPTQRDLRAPDPADPAGSAAGTTADTSSTTAGTAPRATGQDSRAPGTSGQERRAQGAPDSDPHVPTANPAGTATAANTAGGAGTATPAGTARTAAGNSAGTGTAISSDTPRTPGTALDDPLAPDPNSSPSAPPPIDPLVDTDAAGLRKFNIGLVPASVTPPRTWKRAAWFAVVSSAGVLIGLAVAAAKLVGGSGPVERIGMPEYPANVPIVTDFGTRTSTPSASAPAPQTKPQDPGRVPGTPPTAGSGSSSAKEGSGTSGGAGPTTATTPGTGSSGTPGPASTSPTVTTLPAEERPVVDASAIASRTEKFYEEVAANTGTAMALTTETFRSTTSAVLEQRFSDVSLVEVKEISVDPTKGITISTLQITKKDGTASTEQRELTFTLSGEPLINAERLKEIG